MKLIWVNSWVDVNFCFVWLHYVFYWISVITMQIQSIDIFKQVGHIGHWFLLTVTYILSFHFIKIRFCRLNCIMRWLDLTRLDLTCPRKNDLRLTWDLHICDLVPSLHFAGEVRGDKNIKRYLKLINAFLLQACEYDPNVDIITDSNI